ncbi:MAG TPA: hypothetical protein PK573_13005 [Spirochaetota bacterium]|nr:hypothetical protein [Spirochaetota bacterium]HRZ25418.1 hypothetical protein [Spirochaetota bacterium]
MDELVQSAGRMPKCALPLSLGEQRKGIPLHGSVKMDSRFHGNDF